ncbi:hypothetical protein ABW21_db0203195 [Orbilia brochopaga]|nr:hypothetical protein ABW21_db0203195 [Drechslerella brochopaga]
MALVTVSEPVATVFLFSYSGDVDIEFFDAVIEDVDDSLERLQKLAVIPRYTLEKEKTMSGIITDTESWDRIRATTLRNLTFLIGKLTKRLTINQLRALQFDEPNSEGVMFPGLRSQLEIQHLSLHNSTLTSHFATARVPYQLKSLVLNGIFAKSERRLFVLLKHLARYSGSLEYLSLDFDRIHFSPNGDWETMQVRFIELGTLNKLKSFAVKNCTEMVGLQLSTLAFVPYEKLEKLKFVNCFFSKNDPISSFMDRMAVRNLTHLNLTRTCLPEHANKLLKNLDNGLQKIHLEFNYNAGQDVIDGLLRHRDSLLSIWLEASTANNFRQVEHEDSHGIYMLDFTAFTKLVELAIGVNYWALDNEAIDWPNPPNLRILRVLNIDDDYIHIGKCREECLCNIADAFIRIHDGMYCGEEDQRLEVIAFGRNNDFSYDIKTMYYHVKPQGAPPDKASDEGDARLVQQLEAENDAIIEQQMQIIRRAEAEHQEIAEEEAHYDASGSDGADSVHPDSLMDNAPQNGRLVLRGGGGVGFDLSSDSDDDDEYDTNGQLARPTAPSKLVERTTIEELKTAIPEMTILDVDREGVAFWDNDDMIVQSNDDAQPGHNSDVGSESGSGSDGDHEEDSGEVASEA